MNVHLIPELPPIAQQIQQYAAEAQRQACERAAGGVGHGRGRANAGGRASSPKTDRCMERALRVLQAGPKKLREIHAGSRTELGTLREALRRLVARGSVIVNADRYGHYVYSLPSR